MSATRSSRLDPSTGRTHAGGAPSLVFDYSRSVTGHLVESGDGPVARCALCGKPAAGPCARCRALVCGDCCTLTEGGMATWAICLRCERRGGASLRPAWIGLFGWLALLLVGLAAVAALLLLARR